MTRKINLIIIILIGLFIFIVFFKGLEKNNNYSTSNILNKIETNLSAKSLYENKEIYLNDLFDENNFLLINIWSSWCLPCRNEHSYLIKLKKINNLSIVGVNYKDTEVNAKKFMEDFGSPYSEILVDSDGTKSIELGAYGVPETYLVNSKTKEIIKKFIGPLDDLKFKEIIKIVKNEEN